MEKRGIWRTTLYSLLVSGVILLMIQVIAAAIITTIAENPDGYGYLIVFCAIPVIGGVSYVLASADKSWTSRDRLGLIWSMVALILLWIFITAIWAIAAGYLPSISQNSFLGTILQRLGDLIYLTIRAPAYFAVIFIGDVVEFWGLVLISYPLIYLPVLFYLNRNREEA